MKPTQRRPIAVAAVALGVVMLATCAAPKVPPGPSEVDPSGFDAAWTTFLEARRELDRAIDATPDWESDPRTAVRVAPQAERARNAAAALRAWSGGPISAAAIDLLVADVDRVSKATPGPPEPRRADASLAPDDAIAIARGERAWHRLVPMLEPVERYLRAGIANPWVDEHILPQALADARAVTMIDAADLEYWSTEAPSDTELADVIVRARAILDRATNR